MLIKAEIEIYKGKELYKRFIYDQKDIKKEELQYLPVTPIEKWRLIKLLKDKLFGKWKCLFCKECCEESSDKYVDPWYVIARMFFDPPTGTVPRGDFPCYCSYNNKGKYINGNDLCTNPNMNAEGIGIWTTSSGIPDTDLTDYVFNFSEDHTKGVIFSNQDLKHSIPDPFTAIWSVTFTAKQSTTIYGVSALQNSDYGSATYSSCRAEFPAPPGTCDPSSYTTVLILIWYGTCEFSIEEGLDYTINIRFRSR